MYNIMELKKMYCDICKRDYKINYFYTHRKHSQRHIRNSKNDMSLKNILVDNTGTGNDNHIKIFLEDIKNKIDTYLKKL